MTTAKLPPALEPEDLSVRVRRGDSSADERRALERALEGSALLRVAHQVGRDFDETSRVRPGDDELIAHASALALSRAARRRGSRSVWALGVAATLTLAAAAAAGGSWFRKPAVDGTNGTPAGAARTRSTEQKALATPHAPAETNAKGPASAEPSSEPSRPPTPAGQRGHASVHDAAPTNAADLFREANAARRAADFQLARTLYAELQAKHPSSDEARVSRVSLGKLLLAGGRAREADDQFKSYLATGGKNLEEEALVGRADALGRLGASGEERRVWEGLLQRHPSSVYAARARQRLDELRAMDTSERR